MYDVYAYLRDGTNCGSVHANLARSEAFLTDQQASNCAPYIRLNESFANIAMIVMWVLAAAAILMLVTSGYRMRKREH
jgi:hypothetical protein